MDDATDETIEDETIAENGCTLGLLVAMLGDGLTEELADGLDGAAADGLDGAADDGLDGAADGELRSDVGCDGTLLSFEVTDGRAEGDETALGGKLLTEVPNDEACVDDGTRDAEIEEVTDGTAGCDETADAVDADDAEVDETTAAGTITDARRRGIRFGQPARVSR